MAVFNPGVPEVQDPNYLGLSKPISQIEGDKSGSYALKTFDDVLGEGIKGADTSLKRGIENNLQTDIDKERQSYTDALNVGNAVIRGQQVAQAPQGSNESILQPPTQNMPPQLKQLPTTLGTLDSAKANGKLTDTDYIARIDMIAKDYRARYPGQRDYVDAQVQKITGMDPANAYIKSILSDINSFVTKDQEEKNKIRTQIIDSHITGSELVLKKYDTGEWDKYKALGWVSNRKGQEEQWNHDKAETASKEDNIKAQGLVALPAAINMTNLQFSNNLSNILTGAGEKVGDIIDKAQKGTRKLSDEEATQLIPLIQSNRDSTVALARSKLYQPFDPNDPTSKSMASILGEEKTKSIIADAASMHDQVLSALSSKDTGLAFSAMHLGAAAQADIYQGYLKDSNMRPLLGMMSTLQKAGGPNAVQQIITNVLNSDIPAQLRNTFTVDKMRAIAQPAKDIRTYGGPLTVTNLLDEAKDKNITAPQYFQELVKIPTDIIHHEGMTDQGQMNLFKFAFDPKNTGVLNNFKDTQQMGIFNAWTQKGITDEAVRLGNSGHPEVFQQYKTWAEKSFSDQFTREINSIGDYVKSPNVGIKFNDNNQLEAYVKRGRVDNDMYADQRDPRAVVARINQSFDKLNGGMGNLVPIAIASGEKNLSSYLLKSLVQNGADLNKVDDPQGKILRAIMSTRTQEQSTKMQYTDETSAPASTLATFLKNPTGELPKPSQTPSTSNLGDILGVQVDNIPEGMSARDFIRQLQKKKQ